MKKKEIELKYNKLIILLKKYNKYYYEKSNPLVTDKEYDELKKKILYLEKKNIFLNSKNYH